ncbi:MAG: DUF1232 domain-containing protein [Chloroflexota bacterium]|nr:DUF1232 domain-containing protein [Chloroflexota bacterium]
MLKDLIDQIRLTWRLLRDPAVPLWTKGIPFAAILYVLSPIDILPDFIPVIGQIDDIAIIIFSMRLMEQMSPPEIVSVHRDAMQRGIDMPEVIQGRGEVKKD